ncbi:MAG: site-2 protease family protein [Clostridia bacterium]|nr:site-2 protease family protein [Clostridia bacterium]
MLKKAIQKYSTLKFRISPLLFVYALIFTVLGKTYEGFSYIVALVIHEFAHAEEARRRGYVLNSMHFSVFGATLKMQSESMQSTDMKAIAIAGPLVNLCLAVFCTALWWTFPSTYFFTLDFVWANTSLFVFNLIPVYPLDGGRILLSVIGERYTYKKARRILKIIGFTAFALMFALFVLSLIFGIFNPSFLLMSVFIITSVLFPDNEAKYERLYQLAYRAEKLKRGLKIKEIAVLDSMKIKEAYALLSPDVYTSFVVVDKKLVPSKIIPEAVIEENYNNDITLAELVS